MMKLFFIVLIAAFFIGSQAFVVKSFRLTTTATQRNLALFVSGKVHEAALQGDVATVQALIMENPSLVKERDIEGMTPLHIASRNGMLDMARMLLDMGADPNTKNDKLRTSLQLAMLYSDGKYGPEFKEIVKLMIMTGKADIMMQQRNDRMSALDYAKKAKWDKECKALWVEYGSFETGESPDKPPGPGGFPRD